MAMIVVTGERPFVQCSAFSVFTGGQMFLRLV